MVFRHDAGQVLLVVGVVLVVFLVLDLLIAGGGMTGGMMGGMAGMMGTPWGWGLVLLLTAIVIALLAFRV